MDYSWRIIKLGLQDELNGDDVLLENAIVRVKWKRLATHDDGTTASYLGTTDLNPSLTSEADFTALNSVTKAQVVGWIEDKLTVDGITKIDDQLSSRVERNRVNTISPGWN